MFQHMKREEKEALIAGDNEKSKTKPSRSNAGPTPFHRAASYLALDMKQPSRWLIYDNEGSFNGWFDWLPLWMRVGYWSPFVILSIACFYSAIYWFKPQPLEFASTAIDKLEEEEANYFMGMPRTTAIDLALFLWGLVVVVHAKISLGSIGAFPISFTGWSWILITFRAGFDFMAWAAVATYNNHSWASTLAMIGSSLRCVTITNACVVCTIWNFILLPMITFKSIPAGEKRRKFLKFNFGFFMTNIHILNLPLAFVNILNGNRVRLFTMSDLWVAYFVVVLYSIQYYFLMDRLGMHFYPIFNPRTAFSVVSIFCVLGLYYFLFLKWNEYMSIHADIPNVP
mmetsp:Transcript_33933/g.57617  ORF Transcript_33933/g.57617 Transcript_33933/m.57617 type:complete len:341 (+) Transcript_33933:152-1174(+)